jgi:hypothetical protein
MAQRKPTGLRWESWVDRQIREAQERGEFDDLPGAGKPLPDLDRPRDELWWIRKKLRDEKISLLPPALQIRKDIEAARERIAEAPTEAAVRAIVTDLNSAIRTLNRNGTQGPATSVAVLDEEEVVRRWRERKGAGGS